MKRILLSLITVGVIAVVAVVGTRAFFNDTETSTGNVLEAGALDLRVDNTCYYNGLACIDGFWGGEPDNPQAPSESSNICSCTWGSKDLEEGDMFFDLHDLKPGDWEEDTISINVDNPSWLCADLSNIKDIDNTCTEPETTDENAAQKVCTDPDGDGELAENLFFVFWKDDGDNVFEESEVNNVLTAGTAENVLNGTKWALADSSTETGPIGPNTYYIGKFFCFGEIGRAPVANGDGNPVERGSGFTCNGESLDNQSQTDLLTGDINFYAEQARHNEGFLCNPPEPTATEGQPV